MELLKIIFLGFVQGMTEFLPISSSGHILFFQNLLHFELDNIVLTLVLHLGTLVSVCIVLYKDIAKLFVPPFKNLFLLVLATIPAVVVALLFKDSLTVVFDGKLLGFAFLFTAILLFVANFVAKRGFDKNIGIKQAVAMGLMQAVALVPGVSRSGSTIAGGLFCKGDKKQVVTFAFLMSIPVILGGCVFLLPNVVTLQNNMLPLLFCGFLSSLIFGIVAIKLVQKFVFANNFLPFCIYLIVMAVVSFVLL